MKLTPQEQQTIDAYDQNTIAWAGRKNKKVVWGNKKKKFINTYQKEKLLKLVLVADAMQKNSLPMDTIILVQMYLKDYLRKQKRIIRKLHFYCKVFMS